MESGGSGAGSDGNGDAWSKKGVVLRRGRPGRWPAWVAG